MILKVVEFPAPVLTKPARRIAAAEGLDLAGLYQDMVDTMHDYNGIGLAAPQIGQGIRFMIAHNSETGETVGFANPQIVAASAEVDIRSEGCLSFPGLAGDIERYLKIRVKYQDLDLVQHEEEFSGYFARVIQHEIDHLNGVLLPDRALDGLYEPVYEDEGAEGADAAEPAGAVNEPARHSPDES